VAAVEEKGSVPVYGVVVVYVAQGEREGCGAYDDAYVVMRVALVMVMVVYRCLVR